MKKRLLLLFFILPGLLAIGGKVVKTFHFSNYVITQKGQYQTISFDNTLSAGLTGEPALPYQAVALMLPPGEKAVSIEISGEELTSIPGSLELFPQQYMQPVSKGPDGIFVKKEDVYRSNKPYPASQTGHLTTSYLNGYAFALATFTPVTCNPSQKTASYYKSVTISINTAPDAEAGSALKNLTASKDALKRVKMFAQNPEMMAAYPAKPALKTGYQILIITPAAFESGFQPLISYYNTKGLSSQVITTEAIGATSLGQDLPEKMRNYIISQYQSAGIEQVILGGDVAQVPYRGLYCYVISGSGYEDYNIPADLYFSALDGNWNANGNNKWGEPGEDDLLPEISVGRMSFSTADEQANMVHKSITYQSNPGSWQMNKPLLVSEFLYDPPLTYGSDYLELLVNDHTDNGYFTRGIPSATNNITRLYDTTGYSWSTGQLFTAINAGPSFIHHCGHSNATYMMRLNITDVTNANFSQVNGFTHNYQLMYTHGCICGAFDEDDCIAERATTISNWLAAGIFNSRYGWFDQGTTEGPSAHLHREFISAVYNPVPDSAITEIGSAHTMSKIKTAPWINLPGEFEPGAQRWCHYDCNVLGDPAMKIWRDNGTVGINTVAGNFSVSLSPNPCQDQVIVSLENINAGKIRISLVNEMGREIYATVSSFSAGTKTIGINVSSFPAGIYYCHVTAGDGSVVKKLIVVR